MKRLYLVVAALHIGLDRLEIEAGVYLDSDETAAKASHNNYVTNKYPEFTYTGPFAVSTMPDEDVCKAADYIRSMQS